MRLAWDSPPGPGALAQGLNLSVWDKSAYAADIVTGDDEASTAEFSIRRDPQFNEAQKSALLAVYSAMVADRGAADGDRPPNLT